MERCESGFKITACVGDRTPRVMAAALQALISAAIPDSVSTWVHSKLLMHLIEKLSY